MWRSEFRGIRVAVGEKVGLVTGAGRGIGAAIARGLAEAGHSVVAADIDAAGARSTAQKLGPRAIGLRLDVRDRASVEETVAEVSRRFGGLDVLVNCAGVLCTGAFDSVPAAEWDKLVGVNLTGLFHCVQVAAPRMRGRRNASIVNIASISAEKGGGVFGNVWYGATKAAVVAMTKGLARELGPQGIRVNAISPGVVDTEMVQGLLTPEIRSSVTSRTPLRRLVTVEDIARAAVFLSSEEASAITGEILTVDGGHLTS